MFVVADTSAHDSGEKSISDLEHSHSSDQVDIEDLTGAPANTEVHPGVEAVDYPVQGNGQHLHDEAETEVDSGSGSETETDSELEPVRVVPKKVGGRKRVVTLHPPTQIIDGPKVRNKPKWMSNGEYVVKRHKAIATIGASPNVDYPEDE
jgi:hypothetical protein